MYFAFIVSLSAMTNYHVKIHDTLIKQICNGQTCYHVDQEKNDA